jgi:hypothetical protein
MYEVGRAGAFVTGQTWRWRGRGTLLGAGSAASGAVAVAGIACIAFTGSPVLRALGAVLTVGGMPGCALMWRRSAQAMRRAGRSAIGARSEREIQTAIRRTGSVAAAYGLVLDGRGGDCDAVVFTGGCGAAAIEVKTGHGEVTLRGETMWVGRRALPKNPTRQAAHQAQRLSRKLRNRNVQAVVYVPGMTNRPFTAPGGVIVCGAKDLGAVLARAPRVFGSAAEAKETMKRLWRAGAG